MCVPKTARRVGVASINPKLVAPAKHRRGFVGVYEQSGKNTGNLMFTVATYGQIAGDVRRIGYVSDPEVIQRDFDAVVIPCANWLNPNANWDSLADWLEKIEIPVVPIGLGLQAKRRDLDDVEVSASALRAGRERSRVSTLAAGRPTSQSPPLTVAVSASMTLG